MPILTVMGYGASKSFNDTWGDYAPEKDKKYKSKVRITFTNHSTYGSQAIILDYTDFNGPYFYDALFSAVYDKIKSTTGSYHKRKKTKFANGIWDIPLTFINYKIKFDLKNAIKVCESLK